MLEVEAKYRCPDWASVLAKLAQWGAALVETREDTDHYFNAPDRDFAKTDEAVRLRRIGLDNFLTYKGPKRETATKTRTEVELQLASGANTAATAVRFLTQLAYRPVAVVSKTRMVYTITRGEFEVEVCLDDVGSVGRFVEVEIRVDESEFDEARRVLLATAQELGLTDHERRSYLEMLLQAKA